MTQPGSTDDGGQQPQLLAIYLNDHLAAATGGVDLARRAARSQQGSAAGAPLARLAAEIAEDRAALVDMLRALAVPVQRYKLAAGWAAEKAGRLKLNGRLRERSPLSDLVELEGLVLGVAGKTAAWRTLRARAEVDDRLSVQRLDALLERAHRQADTLEQLRMQTAAAVLGGQQAAAS